MSGATKAQQTWQARAADKRIQCQNLIPEAWKLDLAALPVPQEGSSQSLAESRTNLIHLDIPRRSGILTPRELRITESHDVHHLLGALASGDLTALEVTVAFCKRAAIAQQLVRSSLSLSLSPRPPREPIHSVEADDGRFLDVVSDRDSLRASSRPRPAPGFSPRRGSTGRAPPRTARQPQGFFPGPRCRRDPWFRSVLGQWSLPGGLVSGRGAAQPRSRPVLQDECATDAHGRPEAEHTSYSSTPHIWWLPLRDRNNLPDRRLPQQYLRTRPEPLEHQPHRGRLQRRRRCPGRL